MQAVDWFCVRLLSFVQLNRVYLFNSVFRGGEWV